jgi:hypothetical protein
VENLPSIFILRNKIIICNIKVCMSSKIHNDYENPIDKVFINICELLCPFLYRLNFTPNMITTVGLLFGMVCIYYFYMDNIRLAVLFLWISYFFDCLDGHYARKYEMETQFGDYYDHFRDLFVLISVIILILYKKDHKIFRGTLIVLFGFIMTIHLGCQEHHSEYKENNELLQQFMSLCSNPEIIKNTKYFGCGSYMLLLTLLILF